MKEVSILLMIFLLSSACLGSVSFAIATSSVDQPMYTRYGIIRDEEVDYWNITNVNQGATVLLRIEAETGLYGWQSWLFYSNLTQKDYIYTADTHFHDFVADKTDNYLLRLYSPHPTVNYTVNSNYPIQEVPMYTGSGIIYNEQADEWNITDVNKDDVVLLSIQAETGLYGWQSWLFYSNLTQKDYIYTADTHFHDFVADKTDNYLLRLYSPHPTVNYTIESSHPIWKIGAPIATVTRFSIEPNSTVVGQIVSLSGNLTTTEGNPVRNEEVTIKVNGTDAGTLITNSTGWFKASGQVKSAGSFNVTVEYAGSMQYLPSSDWKILVVNKANTSVYAVFAPNPVNSGGNCTLIGILVDQFSNPIANATVTLEYSIDYGSTWNPAGTLTTDSYGIFSYAFTAPSPGTYLVRISYAGSPDYESSTVTIPLIAR